MEFPGISGKKDNPCEVYRNFRRIIAGMNISIAFSGPAIKLTNHSARTNLEISNKFSSNVQIWPLLRSRDGEVKVKPVMFIFFSESAAFSFVKMLVAINT